MKIIVAVDLVDLELISIVAEVAVLALVVVPAHVLAPVQVEAVPVVARKILMELPLAGANGYNHRSESNAT